MGIIFYNPDENGHAPIMISDPYNTGQVIIELRAYYEGQERGAIWHALTRDQIKELRDSLTAWLTDDRWNKIL